MLPSDRCVKRKEAVMKRGKVFRKKGVIPVLAGVACLTMTAVTAVSGIMEVHAAGNGQASYWNTTTAGAAQYQTVDCSKAAARTNISVYGDVTITTSAAKSSGILLTTSSEGGKTDVTVDGTSYSVTDSYGLVVSAGSAGFNLALKDDSNAVFKLLADPINTEGNVNSGQMFNTTMINTGGNGAQDHTVQDSVACTQAEMDKLAKQLFIKQSGGVFIVNKTWLEDKKSQGADNEVKSEINKLNVEIKARKNSGQGSSVCYVEDPVKCVQTTSEQWNSFQKMLENKAAEEQEKKTVPGTVQPVTRKSVSTGVSAAQPAEVMDGQNP
jgi:hypothetical protein